jgi:hypothetical protein
MERRTVMGQLSEFETLVRGLAGLGWIFVDKKAKIRVNPRTISSLIVKGQT